MRWRGNICVAVPGRNQPVTYSSCITVFEAYHWTSAKGGAHMLFMSRQAALLLAIQHSTMIEVCNRITFIYNVYVAVPFRNRRLFHYVFRSYHCLRSAISLNFRQEQGSYALHRFIRYSCIYEAHMSPTLN